MEKETWTVSINGQAPQKLVTNHTSNLLAAATALATLDFTRNKDGTVFVEISCDSCPEWESKTFEYDGRNFYQTTDKNQKSVTVSQLQDKIRFLEKEILNSKTCPVCGQGETHIGLDDIGLHEWCDACGTRMANLEQIAYKPTILVEDGV